MTVDAGQGAAPTVLRATDIHKSYGDLEVLKGVSLEVHRGETVCVIGASGSGKSTLLRCVNHLERFQRGTVHLSGELVAFEAMNGKMRALPEASVARQRSRIGMVFQDFNLFPHMTALENVIEAPVHVLGESKDSAIARAEDLLDRVGLGDKRDSFPNKLSGGQQQRVAIARALAMRPKLMLFDEPTSALDPEVIGEVLSVMSELAMEGMTMLVVTHELGFAREAATRIAMMDGGRIIEEGAPAEVLDRPTHERTQRFLSKVLLHDR